MLEVGTVAKLGRECINKYDSLFGMPKFTKIALELGKVQLLLSTCRRYDRDLSAGWQEYW